MKLLIRFLITLLLFAALPGCIDKGVDVSHDTALFRLNVVYEPCPGPTLTADMSHESLSVTSKPSQSVSYYNMARALVFDLSGHESWVQFLETDEGLAYALARDSWNGNRRSHAAWKGFIGGYFDIVADQNLTLNNEFAVGVVSGVIGLNRIIIALSDGDLWVYRGEKDVIGISGEMTDVTLFMENVESWSSF